MTVQVLEVSIFFCDGDLTSVNLDLRAGESSLLPKSPPGFMVANTLDQTDDRKTRIEQRET